MRAAGGEGWRAPMTMSVACAVCLGVELLHSHATRNLCLQRTGLMTSLKFYVMLQCTTFSM